MLNGTLCGYFKGQRGLRQGNPLSPLLFVLVMDYLSKALSKLFDENMVGYHPKCKRIRLSHLMFAGDIMIFAIASIDGAKALKYFLNLYG